MASGKLFGGSPVGAITVVDAPVSLAYARKARITFLTVSIGVALAVSTVLSVFAYPVLAVLIGILAGLVCGFVAGLVVRIWPVLRVLWWWSLEITLAVLVVLVPSLLARLVSPWAALGLLIGLPAACAAVSPVRRRLAAWSWCVVVRHRLRVCFARVVRSANRVPGAGLPLVLWARPTPAGERVWVWLRPGLDLVELDGKTGLLAVTCWASEVRLCRASERFAALLRVDISRRDPLTGKVSSPLALLLPSHGGADDSDVPVSPAVAPVGLDLADVPEPVQEPQRGARR